jgi:competence protein ComEA
MSIDLLSLALAAAMPLAAFALYALIRSWADAWGRRPSRPRRATRSPSVEIGGPVVIASRPSEWPEPGLAQRLQPAPAQPPVAAQAERPEPARRMLAKLPVSRPVPASSDNGHVALPARPVMRDGHPTERGSSPATSDGSSLAATPRASPAPGGQVPLANGRGSGSEAPAPQRRRGLLSNPLKPIRTALGLRPGDRRAVEPSWPAPDQRDESFVPVDAIAEGSGPCPFCAESRERGAWFCRRCRRPVDPRATAATAAVSLQSAERSAPATPSLATATPAPTPAGARPAGRPVTRVSGPLIARLPVLHPTQYVPATRPAGGSFGAERPAAPAPAADQPVEDPPARAAAAAEPGPTLAAPPVVRPAAIVAGAPRRSLTAVGPGRPKTGGLIDLNRASAEQLSALRGVGLITARRIIAAREEQSFATVDALADRKVVGRSVVDKLRDQLTV